MSGFLVQLGGAAILSATLTAILFRALSGRIRTGWLLSIGMLPVIVVYLSNPYNRVYSYHGFMHVSIVHQILNGFLPPESPLLGGWPLHYPWGHHAVVAGLVAALDLSPATVFAWINVVALALTLVLIYRTARQLGIGRDAGVLGTLLAVGGLTVFNGAPVALEFLQLTGARIFSLRGVVVTKFTNLNSMPLGILGFALFLHCVQRIAAGGGRRHDALLVLAVAGAGVFYPLAWLALLAAAGLACLSIGIRHGRFPWPSIGRLAFGLVLGSLLASPYLRSIAAGRETPAMLLLPELHVFVLKCARLLFTVLPVAALLWWKRDALRSLLRERSDAVGLLLAAACGPFVFYLALSWPVAGYAEYKFLMLGCIPLGILGGVGLREVRVSHPWVAYALVWSFLVPAGMDWMEKIDRRGWHVSDPFEERGRHLRHADPEQDELYRWIDAATSTDALFVDSWLTVPVFAERQLYVGLNLRRQGFDAPTRDGWFLDPETLIEQEGHPAAEREARLRVAREILSGTGPSIGEAALAALRDAAVDRDIFVVARDGATAGRLDASSAFVRTFQNDAADVYRLTGADRESSHQESPPFSH